MKVYPRDPIDRTVVFQQEELGDTTEKHQYEADEGAGLREFKAQIRSGKDSAATQGALSTYTGDSLTETDYEGGVLPQQQH